MKRTDIINTLIEKYAYKSYLEVGTQDPKSNFDLIKAEHKVSIDPFPRGEVSFIGTSDEYFNSIHKDVKFDIIFIDGLHHSEQVVKDITNSIKHLTLNGTIVCHDCLPYTEKMQLRDDNGGEWTGDVWKAIAKLRVECIDLSIFVVNTDYGCGVIRRGKNLPYTPDGDYLSYQYYTKNAGEMLNVVSIEDFKQWINLQ